MNWFTQHADAIAVLTTFAVGFYILNSKINDIEKDLTVIKTVMIMNHIMPQELVKADKCPSKTRKEGE